MTVDPDALLAVADQAIDLVIPRLDATARTGDLGIETKSSHTDLVTEFDRWAETTIVAAISAARTGDGYVGEEGAAVDTSTGVVWLIDPIDGTTNFVYDLPGWSVSVAAQFEGVVVAGAVHDPVRGERFRATVGGGATLNGEPVHVAGSAELATALVATGFSYDSSRRRAQATALAQIIPSIRDIRRLGGAAVDLCSLACGRVDAYYERGLSPWDYAAGELIATEAGAVIDNRSSEDGALVGAAPGIAGPFAALVEDAGVHTA